MIDGAERQREEDERNKIKQERDSKFYDLEGLKMDQEFQVQGLQGDVDYWQSEMFRVLEEGDYEAFTEFENYRKEAEKQLKSAQSKLDKTEVDFEVERVAKDARELDEEVRRQTAEFE